MKSVGFARVGGIDVFSFGVVAKEISLLALGNGHCVFCGGLIAQVQRERRVVGRNKLKM